PSIHYKRPPSHRTLSPFPTRRSSDLCRISNLLAYATTSSVRCLQLQVYPDPPEGGKERQTMTTTILTVAPPGTWNNGQNRRSHRDRKSTRLNSSHGSISYAVFCLKKK